MKNLKQGDAITPRLYVLDKNTLQKYSPVSIEAWKELQDKKINYVNTPTKVLPLTKEEKINQDFAESKIILPFLKDYKILEEENYTNNLSTKEILMLMKKMINLIKILHKKGIYHSDLHVENIMINKDLDINFHRFRCNDY